jgi:aminoglycoside phosphotransferase family enzyme
MNRKEVNKLASGGIFSEVHLHGHVIETHISWVILSDNLAFKIKKPVKLSFLDFSTLALRKKYCRRELSLNKQWSNIYKKVLPIRNTGGQFTIGGSKGRIVDYAVVMRRVSERLRMDLLLGKNKVSIAQLKDIAAHLAVVHSKARKVKRPFSIRYARNLFNDIGKLADLERKIGGKPMLAFIERSVAWSNKFIDDHQQRFQWRIQQGFQRDVHGDLHSGNIFLEHRPVIFDCIDFNNRYRQIDILYEIAFLAMDIEAFGHSPLAKVLVKEYAGKINCIEDDEDLAILNYFKCLRANVRAKVHMLQATQTKDRVLAKQQANTARKYLRLMNTYMHN